MLITLFARFLMCYEIIKKDLIKSEIFYIFVRAKIELPVAVLGLLLWELMLSY